MTLGWGGWPGGPAPAVGYCAFASKSHSFSLLPGQERDRAGLGGEWGGDRWRLAHLRAQMATPSSRGLRMIEHHPCTHTRRTKKEFTRPFILQLRKWRPRGQHWSSQEPTSKDSVWSEVSVGSETTGFVEERGDTWFHAICVCDQGQHPRHSTQRFRGRKVCLGLQSVAVGWFQGTGRGGEAGLGPTGCSCPLPALPKEQTCLGASLARQGRDSEVFLCRGRRGREQLLRVLRRGGEQQGQVGPLPVALARGQHRADARRPHLCLPVA